MLHAQHVVLRRNAGGAVVQVADTQIFATHGDQGRGTETEGFGTEHGRLYDVESGLEAAIGLQAHLVA